MGLTYDLYNARGKDLDALADRLCINRICNESDESLRRRCSDNYKRMLERLIDAEKYGIGKR